MANASAPPLEKEFYAQNQAPPPYSAVINENVQQQNYAPAPGPQQNYQTSQGPNYTTGPVMAQPPPQQAVTTVVVQNAGNCPRCAAGSLILHNNCCSFCCCAFLLIITFPIGLLLLCCFPKSKYYKCPNCKYISG